jgi:malate dehydrogenase
VLVVGNPVNTNAAILAANAPGFPAENITSMIRLDHNRAASQLATKAGISVSEIERVVVWGNHSPTMFADWRFSSANGRSLPDLINDEAWYRDTFIPKVAQRGTAIIARRLLCRVRSECCDRSHAGLDHGNEWPLGVDGRSL